MVVTNTTFVLKKFFINIFPLKNFLKKSYKIRLLYAIYHNELPQSLVQLFSDNFSVLVTGSDALASCISVEIERLW